MAEQRDLMTVWAGCRRTLSRFATGERAAGAALRALADWTPDEAELDRYGKGELASGLEDRIAALLGKEAAVWLPSGTMAQQIALRIHADRTGGVRSPSILNAIWMRTRSAATKHFTGCAASWSETATG